MVLTCIVLHKVHVLVEGLAIEAFSLAGAVVGWTIV